MRAYRKKLKQIEDLVKKQDAGVILDEQQAEKVANLDIVLEKMAEYTREQSVAIGDEDSDEDEDDN
jgi:hypothetical protein